MYRIGINAHLLSSGSGYRRAGIHHYISQVLRHLPDDGDLEYVVYTRYQALPAREHTQIVPSRWPTERRQMRIFWEQAAWPWRARRDRLDLLHSMAFVTPLLTSRPTVVTVYDLSFIYYPERFVPFQRWYLTSQARRSCRAARRVVAISESARADVQRLFDVPAERIDVVCPGVGAHFSPRPDPEVAAFRHRYGLPERFLLHVGTLQPRKNIPALISALTRLSERNIPLVMVGGKGWLYDEIFAQVAALGLQERVRHLGYAPDDELPLWYNAASLLVFPSVHEGFGMPIVEAMACGTPVVVANAAAAPEAAGDAALFFEPHQIDELAAQIDCVLANSDLAATMRARGLGQAERFSWQRAGREMSAVYRAALQG